MNKKKIILAMIEAGGGHKSPAQATQEAFKELYPRKFDIEVLDFTLHVGAHKIDAEHKKMWQYMLANPVLTITGYYIQDIFGDATRAYLKNWTQEFIEKAGEWLSQDPPDVFVSFHFLNTLAAMEAKKQHNFDFPIITYLTEPMDAHSAWVWPETNYKVVSSQMAKMGLVARGCPNSIIRVIPYLVKPSFFRIKTKREDLIEELGIDESKKTIIMSSGAEGLGRLEHYANNIISKNVPVNMIVVCGRNNKLYEQLTSLKKGYHGDTNIIVLGYVTNMNELISVSDICAVKASPGSTFEALYMNKIPIHIQYITPSEKSNTKYILKNNIGFYTPTKSRFVKTVIDLVSKADLYDEYYQRIKSMKFETGAYQMAEFIAELAVGIEGA